MRLMEHKATRGNKYEVKMWLSDDGRYIDIISYTNGKQCWKSCGHTTRDYAYAAWARYINAARCDDGINYRPIGEKE
jgi:hypothetical protein